MYTKTLSFSEKSKLKPVNVYGKTKFEIEKFLIEKKNLNEYNSKIV